MLISVPVQYYCSMKNLFFLLLLISSAFAQTKKDITLEDIFKKGIFSARGAQSLHSMNDGKTYVSIETDQRTNLKYVAKNNYSDGKTVSVLFRESDLIFKGDTLPVSVEFNNDETKVLIA